MATYNIQSGGVSYRVEAGSEAAAQAAVTQHQFGEGMISVFLHAIYFIFILIPKLCVRFVGWIFGLLFKAGFVGKIIQTIIVAVAGFIISILLFNSLISALPLPDAVEDIVDLIVLLASGGGLAFWYFRCHYETVKFMSASNFSRLLLRCFTICLYGGIAGTLLAVGIMKQSPFAGLVAFGIPFIIALVYWLIKTKPYARPKPDIAGWTSAAEAGDPVAQYNLAIAYDDGWDVKENKPQAFEWYQKSAENGIAEAQYALGQIYSDKYADAFGIAADSDKSLYWVKKAADQGHEGAKEELGEASTMTFRKN
ncbi:hypothetical protein AGMMS50255_1420 [Spirochaetia bacterium]|nr:hypothetical protein AGMMS50255_1420 [Spirochaetia bacterium]